MEKKNIILIFFVTVTLALIIILIQSIHIFLKGQEICLNSGCQIIAGLTNIPSLFFNLIGFIYFLIILALKVIENKNAISKELVSKILNLFLICGASSEGILFSFQAFIAHSYCSYCLFLFVLILILILLRGIETTFIAISILVSEIIIFSLLNFPSALINQIDKGLVSGSFAKTISISHKNIQSKLFLIFSNKCPHCKKVLKTLSQNRIDIPLYLNPLSKISYNYKHYCNFKLKLFDNYKPYVNFMFMKIVQDKEVPLLVIIKPNKIKMVKGDQSIIDYINQLLRLDKKETNNPNKNISTQSKEEGCIFGTSCSEKDKGEIF